MDSTTSNDARPRRAARDLAAALLLAALAGACSPADEPGSAGAAPRAVADVDVADLPVAVAELVQQSLAAVRAAPDSAEAWGRLGAVLDAHGLHERARDSYATARELDPAEFRWAYFEALMGSFIGDDPTAVAAGFERALGLRDDYAPVHVHHGQALLRLGDGEAAYGAFGRAVLLAPGMAVAHRGLGQAELLRGRPAEARAALERAAEMDPEDGEALASLAEALRALGEDAAAAEAEQRAAEHEPRLVLDDPLRFRQVDSLAVDPSSCLRRATMLLVQSRFEEAYVQAVVAQRSAPDEPDVLHCLGLCREALGDTTGAIEAFERVLELAPDYPNVTLRLARLRKSVGYLQRARELYDRVVAAGTEDPWVLRERAEVAYLLGDFAAAAADFERADGLEPSPAAVHHNWGAALGQLGRIDEAVAHLERSLELEPENPKARELVELLRARADAGGGPDGR